MKTLIITGILFLFSSLFCQNQGNKVNQGSRNMTTETYGYIKCFEGKIGNSAVVLLLNKAIEHPLGYFFGFIFMKDSAYKPITFRGSLNLKLSEMESVLINTPMDEFSEKKKYTRFIQEDINLNFTDQSFIQGVLTLDGKFVGKYIDKHEETHSFSLNEKSNYFTCDAYLLKFDKDNSIGCPNRYQNKPLVINYLEPSNRYLDKRKFFQIFSSNPDGQYEHNKINLIEEMKRLGDDTLEYSNGDANQKLLNISFTDNKLISGLIEKLYSGSYSSQEGFIYDMVRNKQLFINDIVKHDKMEVFNQQVKKVIERETLIDSYERQEQRISETQSYFLTYKGVGVINNANNVTKGVKPSFVFFVPYTDIKELLNPEFEELLKN